VQVRGEDFSSYLSKLSTPRELLIMMTEMFARIEAHPEGGLTAQVRQGVWRAAAVMKQQSNCKGVHRRHNT
jgi:hypothetical protein